VSTKSLIALDALLVLTAALLPAPRQM